VALLTDEHVPSVFVTTLRSNGHEVVEARDAIGAGTNDEHLLAYCGENDHILVTHDKKDFTRHAETVDHAGVVIYTDSNFLREDPESAVRALERVFSHYPPDELTDEIVWLDQWRH
jgi:predicted nuclease of predicted toxin-antitoxin system